MKTSTYKERRRFFRVPTRLHLHFVQDFENIDDSKRSFIDFFSDDIGYTPTYFDNYLSKREKSFEVDISGVLDDKPGHKAVEDALWVLSKKIKLLENALLKLSSGRDPLKERVFSSQYKKLIQPINLDNIVGNEKTKSIINNFDIKIRYFLGLVEKVTEKSNLDELYSEEFIRDFEIELDMISLKRVFRVNGSILAKLFIYLYESLDEIIRVFNDVINGRTILDRPDLWALRDVKISAGGVGFNTTYLLEKGMILDLFFSLDGVLDHNDQVRHLHQKAKVIHIKEHDNHYYVGTMFLGVTSKQIDLLNSYAFNTEVSETIDFLKTLPEDMIAEFDFLDLNRGIE